MTNVISQIFLKVRDLKSVWFVCYGLMKHQVLVETNNSFIGAKIPNDIKPFQLKQFVIVVNKMLAQ